MYELIEVKYSDLTEMIQEAKLLGVFLPLRKDDGCFLEEMQKFEGLSGYHFLILQQNNSEILGFATIMPSKEKMIKSIGPIYVKKNYQGKGLGQILVREIISWAKLNGQIGLLTQTWGNNIRSRRIFEKFGFKVLIEKVNTRIDGDSTIQYILKWSPI